VFIIGIPASAIERVESELLMGEFGNADDGPLRWENAMAIACLSAY